MAYSYFTAKVFSRCYYVSYLYLLCFVAVSARYVLLINITTEMKSFA